MRTPELFDAPVRGGNLRVARWPGPPGAPVVVGAHGVTANHLNFGLLADMLGDDVTLIAPDLRGRAGSRELPPPFGMRAHADDLVAVLDHLGVERATFVGHSMGGFVVPAAAVIHPSRVQAVLIADGGLKVLEPPPGTELEEVVRIVIGPSLDRLKMTFESLEAYFDFWRVHPALTDSWSEHLEAYFAYDLIGEPGAFRSSVSLDAVLRDSTDTLADEEALTATEHVTQPFTFLWAARGVFNESPGLYSDEKLAALHAAVPQLESAQVDANHFTLLLGEGAPVVADYLRKLVKK